MIDYGELARETVDAVRPSATEDVLRAVGRRRVRRRVVIGTAGVMALTLVATGGYGYLHRPSEPVPAAHGVVALPTDRAVGAGIRLDRTCGSRTCTPVLTTADGRRYELPGPKVRKDLEFLGGVSLSPDGHWVAYNRAGRVEVRDLTGTRAWRVKGSGDLGTPSAWSANNRWMLVAPAWDRGHNTMTRSDSVIRVDLRNGRTASVDPAAVLHVGFSDGADPRPALLPDGGIAYPVAGDPPADKPVRGRHVFGSGSYRVVDPATRRQVRTIPVERITLWAAARTSEGAEWSREGPSMLNTDPRGTRGVVSLSGVTTDAADNMFALFDLATGTERTVDVSTVLRGSLPGVRYWGVGAVAGDGVTFVGVDGDGTVLGTVTTNASARRVLSVHRIDHPTTATLLPGMPGQNL